MVSAESVPAAVRVSILGLPLIDPIDPTRLGALLDATVGRRPCALDATVVAECGSTNDLALARLRGPGDAPFAIAAETQRAGRGRRGAAWISPPDASLAFTVGWRFSLGPGELAGLPLAIGVALCRSLEALGLHGVGLKWPNDLLHAGGKLAGILVETVSLPADSPPPPIARTGAAIGVGVNVRLDDGVRRLIERPASDLASVAAANGVALPARTDFLAALIGAVAAGASRFESEGFLGVRDEWLALHTWRDRDVLVALTAGATVTGRALGVDERGALLILTGAGVRTFHAGEVSLRPA